MTLSNHLGSSTFFMTQRRGGEGAGALHEQRGPVVWAAQPRRQLGQLLAKAVTSSGALSGATGWVDRSY